MSLCPFAVKKLLPENDRQARIVPVSAIWHSAVDAPGPTSLYGYFVRADVGLESHFFIKLDGTIEQYMDTHVRADANFRANGFWRHGVYCGAISVETEDDGNPDQRIWTPSQVESSIRLGRWIRDEHHIPAVLCPTWDGNGFGYHTLFPDDWTNVDGKTCPGRIRIPQFRNVILPGIAGNNTSEDFDIVPELEILKAFDRHLHRIPSDYELALHTLYAAKHGIAKAWLNIARSEEAQAKR